MTHDLRVPATAPVLRCHERPTALLSDAAKSAGVAVVDPGLIPASEDFANVAELVPTGFIPVGAGGAGCGADHAPDFDIDERAIGLTAEILARAAMTRLSRDD